MPQRSGPKNNLHYVLTTVIALTCCLGQSCSPSSFPDTVETNSDQGDQVLGYRPDSPLVSIDVLSPLPLVASAGSRQIAQPDTVVTLDGSQSADPAGAELTFAWKQMDGPAVNLLNASASLARFTTPIVEEPTTLRFSLTVGNGSSTASDTVEVEVIPIPPPGMSLVISALPSEGAAPLMVTFSADIVEAESPAGTFAWDFGDGTTGEGQTVTHTFSAIGIYVVNACFVSAINPQNQAICSQTTITVTDQPLTAGGGGGGGGTQLPNPRALAQSILVTANLPRIIELSGTEKDGKPLGYLITALPTYGVLNDAGNGNVIALQDLPYVIYASWNAVIYTPATDFQGTDNFRFVVNDGLVSSLPATVTMTVASNAEPAYRTQVPPITPSRWTTTVTAPAPGLVNRDSYLAFFRKYYDKERQYADQIAGTADGPNQEKFARREAFFYKISGQSTSVPRTADEHARRAMTLLAGTYAYYSQGPGKNAIVYGETLMFAGQTYLWIKDSPALTAADHSLAKTALLLLDRRHAYLEKGAMNRSMGIAAGRKIVSILYPNESDAAERAAYCQQVWDDWWTLRDTLENCTPYNSLWWHYMTTWIAAAGTENLYQDAGFKKLAERYLAQATPLGPLPSYGDAVGFSANTEPGRWIALLEKWATVYNDGRYKWVAHRLFEWVTSRQKDMDQWGNVPVWMGDALMDAWLAADDTINEVKPTLSSVVTTRKAMIYTNTGAPLPEGYYGQLINKDIPDKLVLRSGWGADDMYALVELAPRMGHGHGDAGSINYMTSHGSVLLASTSYQLKDHRFHNAFQLIRPGPNVFDDWRLSRVQTSVPVMVDGQLATYAHVHIDDYLGQPAALDRKIFFIKNVLTWVQDTLNVSETMQAKVGPAWQTVAVYPKRGSNWANTCLTSIPVASIWDLKYLMQWTNIPWDLLVTFIPDTHATLQIDDVTIDDTKMIVPQKFQNTMKSRLWYKKDTTLQPGTPVRFNSVLTPHTPIEDCSSLAGAFRLEVDTPETTVVKIALSQTRTMWLGINDAGNMVETGPIKTDARQFLVDIDGSNAVQYWLVQAKDLTVNNQALHTSVARETKEKLRQ